MMDAKKGKMHKILGTTLLRLVLILTTLIVILPIIWAIYTSFKTSTEFLTSPWALPKGLEWGNYYNAFVKANMGDYFINSIGITIIAMGLLFVLIIPASYALSRFNFKLAKPITMIFMAGLFINSTYIVVPMFLMLNKFNMLDNRLVLAVVYAVTSLPFNIYLLTGFMEGIPKDYEESAQIDGCGYWGTMLRIVVPMSKPGLVTIVMFSFMSYWNEYVLALTMITTETKRTLSVGLKNLMEVQKYATDWGAMFAGLVIVMVPTMIFYALVQKKLTSGLSLGGLKG
ncbi:MAG: carbohydrate ABC transporter permease [Cellulosilyticaceae bacterium]